MYSNQKTKSKSSQKLRNTKQQCYNLKTGVICTIMTATQFFKVQTVIQTVIQIIRLIQSGPFSPLLSRAPWMVEAWRGSCKNNPWKEYVYLLLSSHHVNRFLFLKDFPSFVHSFISCIKSLWFLHSASSNKHGLSSDIINIIFDTSIIQGWQSWPKKCMIFINTKFAAKQPKWHNTLKYTQILKRHLKHTDYSANIPLTKHKTQW